VLGLAPPFPALTPSPQVALDDINFHECVRLDEFESARTVTFLPPEGEFVVLNYRISAEFRCPFRIFPAIEEESEYVLNVSVVVRADMPETNHGTNVVVRVPVPRATAAAAADGGGPGVAAEYQANEKRLVFQIKKMAGGAEHTLKARVTLSAPCTAAMRKEVGPIALSFEIPMYNVSNLQVRYLRINDSSTKRNAPNRWVRYVTQSSNYVCRT